MTRPEKYSLIHYLEAKRTVDDRALNQQCWTCLARELARLSGDRPLQVLEVGAGVGTMVERFVEWGISRNIDYKAIDVDPTLLARASERLPKWAQARGWRTEPLKSNGLTLEGLDQRITVEFLTGDVFNMAEQESKVWDLVMAHAFLDLVDLHRALPCLPLFVVAAGRIFLLHPRI
jgi:SAM-dependent methyltransferase